VCVAELSKPESDFVKETKFILTVPWRDMVAAAKGGDDNALDVIDTFEIFQPNTSGLTPFKGKKWFCSFPGQPLTWPQVAAFSTEATRLERRRKGQGTGLNRRRKPPLDTEACHPWLKMLFKWRMTTGDKPTREVASRWVYNFFRDQASGIKRRLCNGAPYRVGGAGCPPDGIVID